MPQPIYQIGAGAEGPWAISVFHLTVLAGTNPTVVKASSGFLFGYRISNNAMQSRKVAFHDTNVAPVAGVNVYFSLDVHNQVGGAGSPPPATLPEIGLFIAAGIVIPFVNGIAITTVVGTADSDATPVSANDLNIMLLFR